MKKILIILTVAVLVISGCGKKASDVGTNADAVEVSVTTQKSEIRDFSVYSTYTGDILPNAEVNVTPKVSGKIVADEAEIGKYVEAGAVLFKIDSKDQSLQVAQAQASYNSAVANYERTVGGSAQQSIVQLEQAMKNAQTELNDANANLVRAQEAFDSRITINQAKNAVDQAQLAYDNALELLSSDAAVTAAQTNYDSAKHAYERKKELYDSGAVSQSLYEDSENACKAAEAQLYSAKISAQQNADTAKIALDNAQQRYREAEINLTTALDSAKTRAANAQTNYNSAVENYNLTKNVVNPENAKTAKAQVESARAALNIAKQTLENTVVVSPISGMISAENISIGEIASPQATSVTVVDLSGASVEVDISENTISSVSVGTAADISVSSAGIKEVKGAVAAVSPVAKNGVFNAKIYVNNSDGLLKGGMVANVSLETGFAANAVVVPAAAVTTKDNESYVYINKAGKAEKTVVTLGIADDNNVQILSGLEGGEEIVVKGKDFITPGCTLKVTE